MGFIVPTDRLNIQVLHGHQRMPFFVIYLISNEPFFAYIVNEVYQPLIIVFMKNLIMCYIVGILALFAMLVCVSVKEYECAFVLSVVELTAFVVANFNQSERIIKRLHSLTLEMYRISDDISAIKSSIEIVGILSNRNMIDVTASIDEINKEINKIEEEINNINLKTN